MAANHTLLHVFFSHIWQLKSIWIVVLAFLLPIGLLTADHDPEMEKVAKCAYVIIVMAIMWLSEAIPIPATALMPIFMFPMLGVAQAKEISGAYLTDTSFLFLGGLFVAVAIEEWGLHIRIALGVMRIVGSQPMLLMLGLMLPTWFLSMWISNTAATTMMIPIIQAVITTFNDLQDVPSKKYEDNQAYMPDPEGQEMDDLKAKQNGPTIQYDLQKVESDMSLPTVRLPDEAPLPIHNLRSAEMRRLAKGFSLCVAYAANIGGIATLTGTPPNLVLKEVADKLYADHSGNPAEDSGITFAQWMGFAFPLSLLTMILAWLWLALLFIRCGCFRKMDPGMKKAVSATITKKYRDLGPIRFVDVVLLIVFGLLVTLWLSRDPPNDAAGWGDPFYEEATKKKYVSDSTPVILLTVALFILPAKIPNVFCCVKGEPLYTPILTWRKAEKKVAWGVIVLLGGGFALAKASKDSGLSQWVGDQLKSFSDYEPWVMNLVFCCVVAAATEVTSNTATATLLMPIMAALAISINIHPLYLMISTGVACSFAFMLPVATPPNAIVFSAGYLTIPDMAIAGLPMNLIAIGCLTLAINTWGKALYDFDDIPAFFNSTITT